MKLYGTYNAEEYQVCRADPEAYDKGEHILYRAGNSPYDSQQYLSAEEGVGLNTMKSYCLQTLEDMCRENNAENLGVEILET